MPSAQTMSVAYAAELRKSRGGGMAALPETFLLTKVYAALVTLANPDRTPPERPSPEVDAGRSGLA